MASNITFNEAIAELTAMQEHIRTSNLPIEAIKMKGVNVTADGEDLSMDQEQAENATVNLFDFLIELQQQMLDILTAQSNAFGNSLKKIQRLTSTAKKLEGLPGTNAEIAAQRKLLWRFKIQNHINSVKMVGKAVNEFDDVLWCFEGSGKLRGPSIMLLQLCHALSHVFDCKANMVKAWEELEAVMADELKLWEGKQ